MANKKIMNIDVAHAQVRIWKRLTNIYKANKIGTAYLFAGPQGCGKEGIAIKFSQLLNCEKKLDIVCEDCPSCKRSIKLQHENVKIVFPLPTQKNSSTNLNQKEIDLIHESMEKKAQDSFFKIRIPNANRILLQSIKELRKNLYLKNISSGRKIVIVFDAHLLSAGQGETGNAFLKILEEPPENTTLILVTDHIELVLPTIRSRCQVFNFFKLEDNFMSIWFKSKMIEEQNLSLLIGLSRGNIITAQFFLNQSVKDLMNLIKELANKVIRANPDEWRKFIEYYSKIAKQDKETFIFHFMLLRMWCQSANRLQKNIDDLLHNSPLNLHMKKILTDYPSTEFLSIVIEIEKILKAISMNLYMPLVLINFLLKTKKYLK